MADFVINPPPTPVIPVVGGPFDKGSAFPVRRVYCIGRNYAAHAVEMGHDPDREPPFFFQKNPDNLDNSGTFPYPTQSKDVHYEAELLVALKSGGTNIKTKDALGHVWGYAPALDMTRRDLQGQAKKMGRPWEIGKAFERSAPVGPLRSVDDVGHLDAGLIELRLNGEIKQTGDVNQMIWKVPEMISYLSDYFELAAGDVIMSGTPAGVGPVQRGDEIAVTIQGLDDLIVKVT